MSVQLSGSYLRRSFQLLSKLEPNKMPQEEAFDQASSIVYKWARKKFSRVFRTMPLAKQTFDDKRDSNELGVLFNADEKIFIFRCSHPDAAIPGRLWITDVELKKDGDAYTLAVRLSVSSLQSCTEDVPSSRPAFIRTIAECTGLSDVVPIVRHPHILSTSGHVDHFIKVLENTERRSPSSC